MTLDFLPAHHADDTAKILASKWQDRGASYTAGDEHTGRGWHTAKYRRTLSFPGPEVAAVFDQARARLINCDFVPFHRATFTGIWNSQGRLPQPGDLLFQRFHLLRFAGRSLLDLLATARIADLNDQPGYFTIQTSTTRGHPIPGSADYAVAVERGEVVFEMQVIARPGTMFTWLTWPLVSWYQKKFWQAILTTMVKGVRLDLTEGPNV
ncbi:MAG: DUF1990 family protein [Chloroflexi bacterium]|nr:DUF1990 family protein [Chloroflexota bacterium]